MAYIDGFVIAVSNANKDAFIEHARTMDSLFMEFGALRIVECWGDDVSHGKQTDFYRATRAEPGEAALFSWTAWPDRATCDEAGQKMQAAMEGQDMPEMPFDGMRMFWGGFLPIFDSAQLADATP